MRSRVFAAVVVALGPAVWATESLTTTGLAHVQDGLGQWTDASFYERWMYDDAYLHELARDPNPTVQANKLLVVQFEAELARVLGEGRLTRDVDSMIERYTMPDYLQDDPNIPQGRKGLSEWLTAGGMHKGGGLKAPPPPIALIGDGDLVSVMLKLPPQPAPDDPKKLYPGYMISVFRVKNGKVAEHFSSTTRGAYWCRIGCGPKPGK